MNTSNFISRLADANQILEVCQSQRDCVPKPRVARHELPWVSKKRDNQQPQRGCDQRGTFTKAETPLGFCFPDPLPQGSSCLATLGFVAESRWDSGKQQS